MAIYGHIWPCMATYLYIYIYTHMHFYISYMAICMRSSRHVCMTFSSSLITSNVRWLFTLQDISWHIQYFSTGFLYFYAYRGHDFYYFLVPIFGPRWPLFGRPWPSPGPPGLRFNSLDLWQSSLNPWRSGLDPQKTESQKIY